MYINKKEDMQVKEDWIDLLKSAWKRFKDNVSILDLNILKGEDLSAWENLFMGKLVPHLENEGCLVVAVAGGTNTGKSTILNVLMKKELTATDPYAAATKRPVIIASEQKAKQCLDNNLFLEFEARKMEDKKEAISESLPNHILLVKEEKSLPDTYLYLDTPDIDSIAKEHWEIADKIVSAGDIIIAVTNDSKYMDESVIKFFRRACEEGKIVIPVMNKVDRDNPESLQITDKQIREFMRKVEMDENSPHFYFPKYPYNENFLDEPIKPLTGSNMELREYIRSFPVQETKTKILEKTISRFKEEFIKWYQNKFEKLFKYSLSKIKVCEGYLRDTIIGKEFIPFRWIRMVEEIKYELRKQIGYVKYFFLFPTSIFSGYRSEMKKLEMNTEGVNKKIKQQHNEMIEKCFNELLDWLLKSEFISEIDYMDKNINKRLHELHNNRDALQKKIITRMETLLSIKPEWLQVEIEEIVDDFFKSPNLKGFYGKRIISFLLLGAGFVSMVWGMPYVGPWAELIAGGGMLGGSALIETIEYKRFRNSINSLYKKWIEEKQREFSQILKEEVLQYVLQDIYQYLNFAEQFDKEVQDIFNGEFPLQIENTEQAQIEANDNSQNKAIMEKQ